MPITTSRACPARGAIVERTTKTGRYHACDCCSVPLSGPRSFLSPDQQPGGGEQAFGAWHSPTCYRCHQAGCTGRRGEAVAMAMVARGEAPDIATVLEHLRWPDDLQPTPCHDPGCAMAMCPQTCRCGEIARPDSYCAEKCRQWPDCTPLL